MLKNITIKEVLKIKYVFPFAKLPSAFVILEFSYCWLIESSELLNILSRAGMSVNVIIIDTIRPRDIIQPKSIIGLMPLNIKDKNAHIVVRTV